MNPLEELFGGYSRRVTEAMRMVVQQAPADEAYREAMGELGRKGLATAMLTTKPDWGESLQTEEIEMEAEADRVFPWIDGHLMRDAVNARLQMQGRGDFFGIFRVGREVYAREPAVLTENGQVVREDRFFKLRVGRVKEMPVWEVLHQSGENYFSGESVQGGKLELSLDGETGVLSYYPDGETGFRVNQDEYVDRSVENTLVGRMYDEVRLNEDEARRLKDGEKLVFREGKWQVTGGLVEVEEQVPRYFEDSMVVQEARGEVVDGVEVNGRMLAHPSLLENETIRYSFEGFASEQALAKEILETHAFRDWEANAVKPVEGDERTKLSKFKELTAIVQGGGGGAMEALDQLMVRSQVKTGKAGDYQEVKLVYFPGTKVELPEGVVAVNQVDWLAVDPMNEKVMGEMTFGDRAIDQGFTKSLATELVSSEGRMVVALGGEYGGPSSISDPRKMWGGVIASLVEWFGVDKNLVKSVYLSFYEREVRVLKNSTLSKNLSSELNSLPKVGVEIDESLIGYY